MQEKHPWFIECAQVATMTDIGKRHDILSHLKEQVPEVNAVKSFIKQENYSLAGELSLVRHASQVLNEGHIISAKDQIIER
ncbi:hypothetical protein AB1I62_03905 [Enterococcus sp. AN402]|uniref:hypothetical protein n=1 Tax=Enterococcus sp. AN402 TaxID=3151386 RepID=UPI00345956DB